MNNRTRKIVYTALMAVVNYIAFTYGKISIPITDGATTAIHIANAIVVVSAWLLGPVYGGLAGAIGLSIADILDPRYITSAPKTFILKFMIGLIAGTVANRFGLAEKKDRREITLICTFSAILALGFNVIFDPLFGYVYRRFLLGLPQEMSTIIATWAAGATAINAVICVFVSVLLYLALYKSLLPRVR